MNHPIPLRRALVVCIALIACAAWPLAAQTAPDSALRVTVFGFLNLTGDKSFDNPTETATGNLLLSLRMMRSYEVIESDMILRNLDDSNLSRYCRINGVDRILYGSLVAQGDGTQRYTLSVFDNSKGKTTISESRTGTSALDVFGITDELMQSVFSSLAGKHISFGSLNFVNSGSPGTYEVSVDGTHFAGSPKSVDYIVSGTHTVIVTRTDGPAPETVISASIDVKEGKTDSISFTLASSEEKPVAPAPEPAEKAKSEEPVKQETPKAAEKGKPAAQENSNAPYRSAITLYVSEMKPFDAYAEIVNSNTEIGVGYEQRILSRLPWYLVVKAQYSTADPSSAYHEPGVVHDIDAFAGLAGIAWEYRIASFFSVVPELTGGMVAQTVNHTDGLEPEKEVFWDALIESAVDLRFMFKSFGITVAPVFECMPEIKSARYLWSAGGRIGLVWRFNRGR